MNTLLTNLRQERYHGFVAAGTDWNTLTTPGYYIIDTLNCPHAPDMENLYVYGILVVETAHDQELATVIQIYYPHVTTTERPITSCLRKGHDKANWKGWEYAYNFRPDGKSFTITPLNQATISSVYCRSMQSGTIFILNFDVEFTSTGISSETTKFRINDFPLTHKITQVSGWSQADNGIKTIIANISSTGEFHLYTNNGPGRYAGYVICLL